MKKIAVFLLTLSMLLSIMPVGAMATAQWDGLIKSGDFTQEEFDAWTKTTVYRDENSVTGYMVSFRYYAPEAARVRVAGEWAFSDVHHASLAKVDALLPDQWYPGCFPSLGSSTPLDMTLNAETGYWSCTIPLPSGIFNYQFWIGGEADDNTGAEITADPQNRPIEMAEGNEKMSQVFMPFDPDRQIDDYSNQGPRTDGQAGEVSFVNYYSSVFEAECPLGVYLPYGYDAERDEPYKVLYLAHGGGSIESFWMSQLAAPNIADNLIAQGIIEPTIIVTPNLREPGTTGYAQDVERNIERVLTDIIPFIEANYNVSTAAEDRALAGLSMGSMFTWNTFYRQPLQFGYFGTWSSGVAGNMTDENELIATYDLSSDDYKVPTFVTGCGTFASDALPTYAMQKMLTHYGIEYTSCYVNGAHRCHVWSVQLEDFMKRVLWK
ncbi:MAG: alpha/beta hydrolase-fold protein [Clostridia bacterium]|nr:alpha/beta hydrolase-fold protein [Clostridia bacterium]